MKALEATPEPKADPRRFLSFTIASRLYAIDAQRVREIIRPPPAARVPEAPAALIGLINLRGAVLPLFSLRALLALEEVAPTGASRAIVLADAPGALLIDAAHTLVATDAARIETRPAQLGLEPGERALGAFDIGDGSSGIVKILDVTGLIDDAFTERKTASRGAAADAARTQSADVAIERLPLLAFEVSGQEFALDLSAVSEIVPRPERIADPVDGDAAVIGLAGFRERLLPLFSLRALLGLPLSGAQSGRREKVIVTQIGDATVGLVVDRAKEIMHAPLRDIDPTPAAIAARISGEARMRGIYRAANGARLIAILAPERLFRDDVMPKLTGSDRAFETPAPARAQERKLVVFRLMEEEFALPVEAVDEVARAPNAITRVPKTPDFLEGLVALRGEAVPVIDQRRRFGMPPMADGSARRLIVLRAGRHRAALLVDHVVEVLRTDENALAPPPELTGDITRLVRGVLTRADGRRLIMLLDPTELLTRAEQGMLDALDDAAADLKPTRKSNPKTGDAG